MTEANRKTVTEIVTQKLAASGPEVFDKIVAHLTEREVQKRVGQVIQVMTELDKLESQYLRMKPDQKIRAVDGSVVSEGFSEQVFQNREKLGKQIASLEEAIRDALQNTKFEKLEKVLRGSQGGDKETG